MAIVDEDLERVRATVSIVDVIGQHVALKRVGRNWVGLCPFHAERSGSFNVREETGRYKCFGCGAGGDVFKFVQEFEHVDFAQAVEQLAATVGIQLRYTTGGEGRDRQRRKQLIEAMHAAVEWYHERLLTAADARPARDYLRQRGLSGEVARQFRLGWAPDEWDALSRCLGAPAEVLSTTGLAFKNKAGRMQDQFRNRVLFPIFSDTGEAVAFGGRILPGSSDPAKYKNSQETPIYSKSKTLYGLNWAKAEIVASDEVVICEGYTDVIGFHRAGVKRAVATCGTALTEEHVRILKRFASRVVLAFDADAAGQGAAEKFYEWEQRYEVEVKVARFPQGKDPGDLSVTDPEVLPAAVSGALPFLGFRLQRALASRPARSPEDRARAAEAAMTVINEHPSRLVRDQYASQVAVQLELPPAQLVQLAERRATRPQVRISPTRRVGAAENAEFVAVALLMQRWEVMADWLIEEMFADDVCRRAFLAVAASEGHVEAALAAADPEARELLERASVADLDADPRLEALNLLAAAARRVLSRRIGVTSAEEIRDDAAARRDLEAVDDPATAEAAIDRLLTWLVLRSAPPNEELQ